MEEIKQENFMKKNLRKVQEIKNPTELSVSLDPYEWHELLEELEYLFKFINRSQTRTVRLYEKIASQLSNLPVKVNLNRKPKESSKKIDGVEKCPKCKKDMVKRSNWWGRLKLVCKNLTCKEILNSKSNQKFHVLVL